VGPFNNDGLLMHKYSCAGDHIPMEGDEHNDWLGTGNLEQYNDTKHLLGDALGLSYNLLLFWEKT
jgi:hypothetical protein